MTVLTLVASAGLQESTEPLPINPAAHLITVAALAGWSDRGDAARYPGIRLVKGAEPQ